LRLRLKENFDRFNFAIHKEKEMADFRRLFTALTLLALFVGLASAQGGLNNSSTMTCNASTTVTPTVRSEGFTELVGDIVLNCTGGNPLIGGAQIPQANIVVFTNTQVTSRIMNSAVSNASETLLLIDDPGSISLTTVVPGYGNSLPQIVCTTPTIGCIEYVGNVPAGFSGDPYAGTAVPVTAPQSCPTSTTCVLGSTPAQNVFQGIVTGSNQVTFFGVPILPPSTTGSRIYRITNLRANANGISGGGPTPGTITASVSISPANAFTINQPLNTVAFVQSGLTTALRSATNLGSGGTVSFNQCSSASFNTTGAAGILRYTENYGTAFKTRFNVQGAPSVVNGITIQNTPGAVYNSESGFVQTLVTGANGTIAGVADWGTRLKAVFSNIPSGVSIYVSTLNIQNTTTAYTNTAGQAGAALVTSETVPDANGVVSLASVTNTVSTGTVGYTQLTVVNGSAVAVWEVTSNNYVTIQNFDFAMFISYSASPGTGTPVSGPISVNMSYAPNPTNGAFTAASGPTAVGTNIPRFADTSSAKTFAQINICQTLLLFPFVTTATGFETGLAISNTSQDVVGTTPQSGSCTMSWFQAGVGATNPAATTTPIVPGGTTFSTLASAATNAGPNFTGYMMALCNFQYAHGYAAITDTGARGIFASYLALIMSNGTAINRGVSNSESLTH